MILVTYQETFPKMTTTILALGFRKDDLKHLDNADDKVLLSAMTLGALEAILDIVEEIDTILLDSHFLTRPRQELRNILGLKSLTTQIVLHYYAEDELDLDSLRQLGIDLLQAPMTSDGWQALTEGH